MKIKTKAQFAEEVRAEHFAAATSTPDGELKEWSLRIYNELKAADNALISARTKAQELDTIRKDARTAHRRAVTPETTSAWRTSVVEAEAANVEARTARDHRNYLGALSELLATLLRERRNLTAGAANQTESGAEGTRNSNPLLIATNENAPGSSSEATATAAAAATAGAMREDCPFCNHSYTVRDGTLPQLDAEGNRLQLRKCMCREMAPPCKNCPTCKLNATLMKADVEEQLRMCREELHCEICACECPGAGKWIQGDEDSRARFRDRTARRHAELSALLQGSWDDNGGAGGGGAGTATATVVGPSMLRRLPADIKDQIIAARAAESLFSALDSTAVEGGTGGGFGGGSTFGGGATTSAHGGGAGCGRMCCGEAITTVKRRRLDNAAKEAPVPPATGDAAADPRAADGGGGTSYHEGCGDHCDHDHEHHHHHDTHHVHRCAHPHDECTSDCCSAISTA